MGIDSPVEMEAFFTERASTYDAHMAARPERSYWIDLLRRQLPFTRSPLHVLDLGCGTGTEIRSILARLPNAHLKCIDLSEAMLGQLRTRHADVMSQIETVKASYLHYELGQNAFDYAIACVTMHHWLYEAKRALYRRIWAALKPGGTYIVSDYMVREPEEVELLSKYKQLVSTGVLNEGKIYHVDIPFSVKSESRVLEAAGFMKIHLVEETYSEEFSAAMIIAHKPNRQEMTLVAGTRG